MVSVKVNSPNVGNTVLVGQDGVLSADVHTTGIFNISGSVVFEVKDHDGNVVLCGKGDVAEGKATLPCQWPSKAGTYSVTATCEGYVLGNNLGSHTIDFYVIGQ